MDVTLSHYQVVPLLKARREGKTHASTSTDLGLTTVQVELGAEGIRFPTIVGAIRFENRTSELPLLLWSEAEKIAKSENACFVWRDGTWGKIQTFSEFSNRPYSLYPTRAAPTMLVAGFPMHRIKDSDPYRDTLTKVKALAPITGVVLDTATGLGYTAIEMAKAAQRVVTIELDPAAQVIARQNPWSRTLFERENIEQKIGDSFELVPAFEPNTFDRILHDPPTMSLAGDLYSEEFYRDLFRVLKRGGKLFHYIGDPESKFGSNITRGVMERLSRAGFTRVVKRSEAFGVIATRQGYS